MEVYLGEIIGTFLLILLGDGVVANMILNKTKGNGGGWIVISWGWGIAVFVAVFVTASISGAHINPAVTIGLAIAGNFSWNLVLGYILAQMIGAFLGAVVVWLHYRDHFNATADHATKLAVFSTGPEIRKTSSNLIAEIVGTFVLVFGVLNIATPNVGLGSLDALPVALLVFGIGLSLGGNTGYAINPARDLGPRIAHFLLPMNNKGGSDWSYSWIPVLGPIIGAAIAALLYSKLGF